MSRDARRRDHVDLLRLPLAAGFENALDRVVGELIEAAADQPGFLGVGVARPSGQSSSYQLELRFDSPETLARWRASEARAAALARAAELSRREGRG